MSQVPTYNVATITAAQNGLGVTITGTVNGTSAYKRGVMIFVSLNSTVSSNVSMYVDDQSVTTGTGTTTFTLTLSQAYIQMNWYYYC